MQKKEKGIGQPDRILPYFKAQWPVLLIVTLTGQEPGAVVSRFVGDVDVVEKLFTSGIISMFADAFKIISILVVI